MLDGSVTLAWLFQDEKDAYGDAIIAKLPHLKMFVPDSGTSRWRTFFWSETSPGGAVRPTRRRGSDSCRSYRSRSTTRPKLVHGPIQ